MTLHTRHRLLGGPCPKMTTDYCIVIQDQGLYQFSEFLSLISTSNRARKI
ncbi:Uncharacterized protein FWK35_00019060 [Aphis craccivora]|uniref:Uncharacterized protein n=1 Tax=Aphis craccivora TaxID=307492 RepID=A0A6G0YBM9_APHCR|nr:Uncharacterized protein FWK35_00019060 [Aphis craccivora]